MNCTICKETYEGNPPCDECLALLIGPKAAPTPLLDELETGPWPSFVTEDGGPGE